MHVMVVKRVALWKPSPIRLAFLARDRVPAHVSYCHLQQLKCLTEILCHCYATMAASPSYTVATSRAQGASPPLPSNACGTEGTEGTEGEHPTVRPSSKVVRIWRAALKATACRTQSQKSTADRAL